MYHNDTVVVAVHGKWAYNSSAGGEGREGRSGEMNGGPEQEEEPPADGRRADSERTEPLPTHCCCVKERASIMAAGDALVSTYSWRHAGLWVYYIPVGLRHTFCRRQKWRSG